MNIVVHFIGDPPYLVTSSRKFHGTETNEEIPADVAAPTCKIIHFYYEWPYSRLILIKLTQTLEKMIP